MLAQSWLSGINRIECNYDGYLERHLRQPEMFNPHSTPSVLSNIAERIVFTDDVPSLLYEMRRNKQITYEGMFSSVRLPFDCFWLEYKSEYGVDGKEITGMQYGGFMMRHGSMVRMLVVVGFTIENIKHPVCAITHAIEFPEWPIKLKPSTKKPSCLAFEMKIVWSTKISEYSLPDGEHRLSIKLSENDLIGSIVTELMFGTFLVTQPKVYSEEEIKWDARKQLARVRSGKKPLLEHRRINLRICRDAKRYTHASDGAPRPVIIDTKDTESEEAIRHRRYHKVMGHFRHYLRETPPRTIWIEPFYRGDPALGVTFTERDVTR